VWFVWPAVHGLGVNTTRLPGESRRADAEPEIPGSSFTQGRIDAAALRGDAFAVLIA
jgi:hypothetical protein